MRNRSIALAGVSPVSFRNARPSAFVRTGLGCGRPGRLGDGFWIVLRQADLAMMYGIRRALAMPLAERRQRWECLMAEVRKNDVSAWRDDFVAVLTHAQSAPAGDAA